MMLVDCSRFCKQVQAGCGAEDGLPRFARNDGVAPLWGESFLLLFFKKAGLRRLIFCVFGGWGAGYRPVGVRVSVVAWSGVMPLVASCLMRVSRLRRR